MKKHKYRPSIILIVSTITLLVIGLIISTYHSKNENTEIPDIQITAPKDATAVDVHQIEYQKEMEHLASLNCASPASSTGKNIYGDYGRVPSNRFANSYLKVKESEKLNSINIDINTINYQTHFGEISGDACKTTEADTYLYSDRGSDQYKYKGEVCFLSINFGVSTTTIVTNIPCDRYGGANVYFGGDYVRNFKVSEFSVRDLSILNGNSEQKAFLDLVGKSFSLFDGGDVSDMPSANNSDISTSTRIALAEFTNSRVGMYEYRPLGLSSIIIVQSPQRIWAAAKDYDIKNNDSFVRYFSNVPEYKNKVPESIQEWISTNSLNDSLSDDKIIYMSK